jgi:hypothetical protein
MRQMPLSKKENKSWDSSSKSGDQISSASAILIDIPECVFLPGLVTYPLTPPACSNEDDVRSMCSISRVQWSDGNLWYSGSQAKERFLGWQRKGAGPGGKYVKGCHVVITIKRGPTPSLLTTFDNCWQFFCLPDDILTFHFIIWDIAFLLNP